MFCVIIVVAIWMAWRNASQGRGDATGALRLAAFEFGGRTLGAILRMHHVPVQSELNRLTDSVRDGLFSAALACLLYTALEPHMRRRWPQSLISWSRVLSGEVRDTLVGGHILLGTAIGIWFAVLWRISNWLTWEREGIIIPAIDFDFLHGAGLVGDVLSKMVFLPALALDYCVLLFLLRLVLRNTWVASAAFVAVITLLTLPASDGSLITAVGWVMRLSLLVWIVLQYGILPIAVGMVVAGIFAFGPLTTDFSAWYVDKGLILIGLVLAVAIWSFRNALGGRKVLSDDIILLNALRCGSPVRQRMESPRLTLLGCQVGSLLFRIALSQRATACYPGEVQLSLRSQNAVCCLRRVMSGSALPNTFRLII